MPGRLSHSAAGCHEAATYRLGRTTSQRP